MDYELAKQLQSAGFPQDGEHYFCRNRGEEWSVWNMCEISEFSYLSTEKSYFAPTLSELIEALGDKFDRLDAPVWELPKNHPDRIWTAAGSEAYTPFSDGKTPEEAVAKLWLAIHSQELKDSKDMID
jgi:hypothetical protein